MVAKLIRLVIVVAVIGLAVEIFPFIYEWLVTALQWIVSQGKWGVIAVCSCIILSFFTFYD